MFVNFIKQLTTFQKSIKYVYAHNLSGFDGILLLKYLAQHKTATVNPVIFNGKLIAIKFKYQDGKKLRTIVFKDLFLLLPLSLRKLCSAFDVPSAKSHFPFELVDITYNGPLPAKSNRPDITQEEYELLVRKYKNTNWDFKQEAIKYCKLDCKCLFDVIEKFNSLVYKEFNINAHQSLTLPALAMRIYKSQYMPANTIYQLLGQVENDIRQSYTGGAVDVYIPHNIFFEENRRKKLYYYDANSLYPFVMFSLMMPVGKPIAFEGDITQFEKDFTGFLYCEITCTPTINIPILQRRIKTSDGMRTIAGTGSWTGWITTEEWE